MTTDGPTESKRSKVAPGMGKESVRWGGRGERTSEREGQKKKRRRGQGRGTERREKKVSKRARDKREEAG